MLYVGIDQHRKQLTVSVRDEAGNVILRRQGSTEWQKVHAFFAEVRVLAGPHGGLPGRRRNLWVQRVAASTVASGERFSAAPVMSPR